MQARLFAASCLFIAWLGTARGSPLSDAAQQLQPGEWAELTTNNFDSALLDDGSGYHVLYFTEDLAWDPVTHQLLFVGGGHNSDAEFLSYSEATNTWQRSKPGGTAWHENFSHAYDHLAIVPSLGQFFTRQPAHDPSDRLEILDLATGTWSRSAPMPYRPGCCGALEYFPELGGLVHVDGQQGLLLYEPGKNQWKTLTAAGWGDYHNFAEYSPVHKVLIFGGSQESGGQSVFRLNAKRRVARLHDAPQRMGTTHSIVTVDPVSGHFLVFFSDAFYEFHPLTDTWRRVDSAVPWPGGVFGTVATPIATYGINLFAHYTQGSNPRIYLYRHSPVVPSGAASEIGSPQRTSAADASNPPRVHSRNAATAVTSLTVVSSNAHAQVQVPVTFGQVFKRGDVPVDAVLGAFDGNAAIPLQVDKKATHADGSLRHAVLTALIPSMARNGTRQITLSKAGTAPVGDSISIADVLATPFDATIELTLQGTTYSASARALLQAATPRTWLSGPLATEWILSAPVRTATGVAHPHLQARFAVRAYQGMKAVRVEAVVENNWAFEPGPRDYTYDAAVTVAGDVVQFSQKGVHHYRQSRWRRVVWWGADPQLAVRHDSAYLQATRAVPTYDPRVKISASAIRDWQEGLGSNRGAMSIGALEPNMPSAGGRFEIAPLPAFQAGYIISQDDSARRVAIGYGEQAGAWPMHYRDRDTDQPVSIDKFPDATIVGASGIYGNFPSCGGDCSTPLVPEASHHPTLAYVPYLVTGDYYLMEEMVFWGNWVLLYGEPERRGRAQGLVGWDQVRGQAWMLRTLAQSAYATPDEHPLKSYLLQKLQNNIAWYREHWVDSNPLGYVTNTGAAAWLGYPALLSTWMDDFLTWTFGHVTGLGFAEAEPVLKWKAKFPVGRLTDPGMCWVLASTNWVDATHRGHPGDASDGGFITRWTDWRRNVVYGSAESLRGTNSIAGREAELLNAQCASAHMRTILGLDAGQMIGWDGPGAYPANLQAAAAVAVEAGVANAQQAFKVLTSRRAYPLDAYASSPQWALYPAVGVAAD